MLQPLHQNLPHTAGGRVNQDNVPGTDIAVFGQQILRRDSLEQHRFTDSERIRHKNGLLYRKNDLLRVGAQPVDPGDAGAGFHLGHTETHFTHRSHALEARGVRFWEISAAVTLKNVHVVQSGRLNLYQHFVGSWGGRYSRHQLQDIWTTGLKNTDLAHGNLRLEARNWAINGDPALIRAAASHRPAPDTRPPQPLRFASGYRQRRTVQ